MIYREAILPANGADKEVVEDGYLIHSNKENRKSSSSEEEEEEFQDFQKYLDKDNRLIDSFIAECRIAVPPSHTITREEQTQKQLMPSTSGYPQMGRRLPPLPPVNRDR